MYSRSAIKTFKGSGVNPVGAEQPFIYKDPPKAIFTRKYEPVNEHEIQQFIRPDGDYADPTRINESIQYYARGQNPMVEVSYSNAGGAQTNQSLGNFQASNPYKVEVVRPPMYPIETLVPISAPRIHQNYSVQTNPGIAPTSIAGEYDKYSIRQITNTNLSQGVVRVNPSLEYLGEIHPRGEGENTFKLNMNVLKGSIRPTTVISIDPTREVNTLRKDAVRQEAMNFAVNTTANFSNIVLVDPKLNTSIDINSTVKDKKYIAMQAALGKPLIFNTSDGKEIKLKDYTYSILRTNGSNQQMVIQVNQPDVQLERNMPLFSAQSNFQIPDSSFGIDTIRQRTENATRLENVNYTSANSNITMLGYSNDIDRNQLDTLHLTAKLPEVSAQTSITLKGKNDFTDRSNADAYYPSNKIANFGAFGEDRMANRQAFGARTNIPISGVTTKQIMKDGFSLSNTRG